MSNNLKHMSNFIIKKLINLIKKINLINLINFQQIKILKKKLRLF